MALNEELKKIKHLYGEEFMHLCRTLFPTVLEEKGMLLEILTKHFSNNARLLAKDILVQNKITEFTNFVFEKYEIATAEKRGPLTKTLETPYEILKKAGYTLYEATTEKEIQSYRKYYAKDEALCTFIGGRLERSVCFWAIKDNATMLNRADFTEPKREDEYSTSVLAIQFNRNGKCTPSIKSRYNHTVDNPDATYGNNLEKLAPGLTNSFRILLQERGYALETYNDQIFKLENYVLHQEKLYRYNYRAFGAYYCPGNIIVEIGRREVNKIGDPEQKVLIDSYVLDLKEKKIKTMAVGIAKLPDDFLTGLKDIEKIERSKSKSTGETTFKLYLKDRAPATIVVDDLNRIVEYANPNIEIIGDNFLQHNEHIRKIDIPNVKKIGHSFLPKNKEIESIDLPLLEEVGVNFLKDNTKINKVNLPRLRLAATSFMKSNQELTSFEAPMLSSVSMNFLMQNSKIKEFVAPNLVEVDTSFMLNNMSLTSVDLPKLERVSDNFLYANVDIKKVNLPSLQKAGADFLYCNEGIEEINLPKLKSAGDNFLATNNLIKKIELPELQNVGCFFMSQNTVMENLKAPKLHTVNYGFLHNNKAFKKIQTNTTYVNGINIAVLDRYNNVTSEELGTVRKAIEWFRNTTRNILNRNQDEREN